MDEYITAGLANQTIKLCPFCGVPSELASGCNYVTCFCKQGMNGKSEWCWVCVLPKYTADGCNDKTHNSH